MEFLTNKPIKLNNEVRKKIKDGGTKFFDKKDNSVKSDDLWRALYENSLQISYPKNFFEINEIKKLYNTDIDLPSYISALIKIDIMNTLLFGIVYFEKNKKYVKNSENDNNQNQEIFG